MYILAFLVPLTVPDTGIHFFVKINEYKVDMYSLFKSQF